MNFPAQVVMAGSCLVLLAGAAAYALTPHVHETTLEIGTCIDDQDLLIVRGHSLQWVYLSGTPVGVIRPDCLDVATTVTTTGHGDADLKAASWTPVFQPNYGAASAPLPDGEFLPLARSRIIQLSDTYTTSGHLLPSADIRAIALTTEQGKFPVTSRPPDSPPGEPTVVLYFNDPAGGAHYYKVKLTHVSTSWVVTPVIGTLLYLGLFGIFVSVLIDKPPRRNDVLTRPRRRDRIVP